MIRLSYASLLNTSLNSDIFIFYFWFKTFSFSKVLVKCHTKATASDLPFYDIFVPTKSSSLNNFWWRHCMRFVVCPPPPNKNPGHAYRYVVGNNLKFARNLQNQPFEMSQNCELRGCQFYGVKLVQLYFRELGKVWKKVWSASLLPQVVLTSSIKPISSNIFLKSLNLNLLKQKKVCIIFLYSYSI